MKEDNDFLKYAICALIQDLKDNNEDIEQEMKKVGHILGRMALEHDDFQRELDLESLLYKITYTFLDKIYSTSRKLEVSTKNSKEYYIFEHEPLFSQHVSLPESWKDFCPESIMSGVIEYALLASGFECEVNGYIKPCKKDRKSVV